MIAHASSPSFLHVARKHSSRLSFEIQLARNNKKLTIDRFELKSADWPFQIHKNSPSLKRTNYLQKIKHFKTSHLTRKERKLKFVSLMSIEGADPYRPFLPFYEDPTDFQNGSETPQKAT